MFYYLLNNSSVINSENISSSNIKLVLFGTVIYIVIHAFLSFSKSNVVKKLKVYFWFIFILDITITYMTKQKTQLQNDKQQSSNKSSNSFVKDIFDLKSNIKNILNIKDNNQTTNDELNNETQEMKETIKNLLEAQNKPAKSSQPLSTPLTNIKETNELKKEKPTKKIIDIEEREIENVKSTKHSLSTPINKIINKNNKSQQKKSSSIQSLNTNINTNTTTNTTTNTNTNTEELFNDNSSLSGSEMDFDINEFKDSL